MDFEKKIQEERAKKIEKQIIENYENFFKIDQKIKMYRNKFDF